MRGRKRRLRKLGIVEAMRTDRMAVMERMRVFRESFSLDWERMDVVNWRFGRRWLSCDSYSVEHILLDVTRGMKSDE